MNKQWIITIKQPKNKLHDPRNKQTGPCVVSSLCTDVTGEHHSFIGTASDIEKLKTDGTHITRIELLS